MFTDVNTGVGINISRSKTLRSEMKSTDVTVTGNALVNSVKTLSVPQHLSEVVFSNAVPVLNTQTHEEAHVAKNTTLTQCAEYVLTFSTQSERHNPKSDSRSKFNKNKQSKSIGKSKQKASDTKTKYYNNNAKKNSVSKFVPHSSRRSLSPSIFTQAKSTLAGMSLEGNTSLLLETFEVLGALSISLPACKTPLQVASQIVLAIRAMTKGSITESILKQSETIAWCQNLFGFNIFVPQSGTDEPSSDWLSMLPSIQENWETIQHAPLFEKISNLISVAASIGLCSVTNLHFSVKGVELFRIGNLRKHATALDFVSAMLDTTIAFIEGGFECFRQRSFRPLLFTTDEGRQFDEMYFPLIEMHEHAMVFNLHAKPIMINGESKILTDLDYGSMLDEAIDLATRAHRSAKGTWQQTVLSKRLETLRKNRASYAAKRIDGSMRYAPYSVYIWGESGVGKSTVAQIAMADCLNASGANPDSRHTAIIKETDKFDSALKGDTSGIFLDDMGNTKSDFLDRSPCERMIDINNNMITYANKADLHEKGKIEIRPKVLVTTSNAPLQDHARLGSIKPFSIVRRADLHGRVVVRPEYRTEDGQLDKKKVMLAFPEGTSLVNDVWQIHTFVPVNQVAGGNSLNLKPVNGKDENSILSINEFLRLATSECKSHFDIQRKLVAKGENLVESRNYCGGCRLSGDLCNCDFDKQASCLETFESVKTQISNLGSLENFVARVPMRVCNNSFVQKAFMFYHGKEIIALEHQSRRDLSLCFAFVNALLCLSGNFTFFFFVAFLCIHVYVYLSILAKWRDNMCERLAIRSDITQDLFASLRQCKVVQFFGVCILGRLMYSLVMMLQTTRLVQQTALCPTSVAEIVKRDGEVNPWANPAVAELHVEHRNATMTHEQVIQKVKSHLYHIKYVENGFQQQSNILALGGTTYLIPAHIFENRQDMKILMIKGDPNNLNTVCRGLISIQHAIFIPGKDLAIVSILSGGTHSDLIHLFPTVLSTGGSGEMLYRDVDGSMRQDLLRLNYVKDSEAGGPGYEYDCKYKTFEGLCMATMIGKFARSTIAGFHLRGITGTPRGKALIVTQSELREAIALAHIKWVSNFPTHVNGTFPLERYQKQTVISQDIHPKSPINFLPVGSNLEFVGDTGSRVSMTKSSVIETPISSIVEEVTGVPNDYGPPQFHRTRMWQASLSHSANPGAGVEPSLVDRAYVDYTGQIIDTFNSPTFDEMSTRELRPLSEMETLCGRDGARFIDQLPKGTSKGFPLTGPKREMINLLEPEDYPDFSCPAECDPMIIAERDHMRATLLRGVRCYSIFKACVKDEPTKKGKDKVRVFQAADWATQLLVRQYFLPIARMLSLFPLVSECAVGVNAQGPEWDQLAKHMKKFGDDRILAGDYSKYDLRMPAALIIAAFKSLIDIATECGSYSCDDITVMKGIATEIAYSCVAYNGDMIIHRGSNPSGQNLTVYINCIVNSLLLRCAYYKMYPALNGNPEPFQTNVAVVTYGDDVKGSVRKGFDWFNHMSYAAFLKERDMVFTMPDKTSEPTPYMNDIDADFLKRKNCFNPETGLIHGTLDEESIFKSLHCVLESKVVNAEDQSAMNIDGALREWWQYGREVYEMRRVQMTTVAERANISHMCNELNTTYDDRMAAFRERYLEED